MLILPQQLNTPVYTNASAYISDVLSAPPIPQINTIEMFHVCDRILFYWEFIGIGGPNNQYRSRGMSIINVDDEKQVTGHQIEFNSLAWAINIGYNVTAPPGYDR